MIVPLAELSLPTPSGDSVRVLGGSQPFTFVFATAFSAGITQEQLPKLEAIVSAFDEATLRLVIIVLDPDEGLSRLDMLDPATLARATVLLDPLHERRYFRSADHDGFPAWSLFDREGTMLVRYANHLSTVRKRITPPLERSIP